jgi:hypothetical protein
MAGGQCEIFKMLDKICIVVEPFEEIIEDYIVPGEVTDEGSN